MYINLIKKKFLLYVTVVLLGIYGRGYGVIEIAPIENALYAEIHGILGDSETTSTVCMRIYKGAVNDTGVHSIVKGVWCRKKNKGTQLDFYDADGKWLRSESLTAQDSQNKSHFIQIIQQRLTALPLVTRAAVTWAKTPGNQTLYLYNAQGFCIATLNRFITRANGEKHILVWDDLLKKDDLIPESVIQKLSDKVGNVDFLKTLKIGHFAYVA